MVDIPYRKLLENLNKARPGGKCGPEGALGLDVDPPNPADSQLFTGPFLPDYTATPFVNKSPVNKQQMFGLGSNTSKRNLA